MTHQQHLTPAQLRAKALGMREEAKYTRATIDHYSPARRANMKASAERMERMAQELERAAQRAEAIGV
jgi:hypothetical protein